MREIHEERGKEGEEKRKVGRKRESKEERERERELKECRISEWGKFGGYLWCPTLTTHNHSAATAVQRENIFGGGPFQLRLSERVCVCVCV